MKIVSVTLAAPGTNLDDALLSVRDFVDSSIVVDSPLRAQGFAGLRNEGLARAREAGAAWVVWVDADERLVIDKPHELRALLEGSDAKAYSVDELLGMFRQPKIMRADVGAPWVGCVHEYAAGVDAVALPRDVATFVELPKSPQRIAAKIERDLRLLQRQIVIDPVSARWPFYLGETLRLAGKHEEARAAYVGAYLRKEPGAWGAECAGWSMFKAARTGHEGGGWDPLEDLALGMITCPWMVELPWYAAHVEHSRGRLEEARAWARMAQAIQGTGPERRGFREDVAHTFGPSEYLR